MPDSLLDPTYPEVPPLRKEKGDWAQVYGDVKEHIAPDAPRPLGKCVDTRLFVDSDHAGCPVTQFVGYLELVQELRPLYLELSLSH